MKDTVLVVNGREYAAAISEIDMVVESDPDILETHPEKIGLVMFTGGEDVSPSLYNETSPFHLCGSNLQRDKEEVQIYKKCLELDIPMTGICRGSQFLNVMNHGKLIHDLSNHAVGPDAHTMCTNTSNKSIVVNSYHHQASIIGPGGYIIGWSEFRRSKQYIGDKDLVFNYKGVEVEAIYYPDTKCAAVQYHPEWMDTNSDGFKWYSDLVKDLLILSELQFLNKYTTKYNTLTAENL